MCMARVKQALNVVLITHDFIASKITLGHDGLDLSPSSTAFLISNMAECLLLVRNQILQSDFPFFMDFVLLSPQFKIVVMPQYLQDLLEFNGAYFPDENTLGFFYPESDTDNYNNLTYLLPLAFWKAYQTVLQTPNHDPVTALKDQRIFEKWKAGLSWNHVDELAELKRTLAVGNHRVTVIFKGLLEKQKNNIPMSLEEKKLLRIYMRAVKDYNLRIYDYKEYLTEENKAAVADAIDNNLISFVVGVPSKQLFNAQITLGPDYVMANGTLVEDSDDNASAFIEDILFLINNGEREAETQRQRRSATAETMKKFAFDIIDLHLARHSALLNKTFYPERYRYHAKRFEKLSNYALPLREEILVWDEPPDPEIIQPTTNRPETQEMLSKYEYLYKSTLSSHNLFFWKANPLEELSQPSETSNFTPIDLSEHTIPVFSSHRR
jgi:hypothetical protein